MTPIAAPAPPTAPQAASAFAFAWPWKQVVMIDEGGRREHRRSETLTGPCREQRTGGAGEGRGERRHGEDTEAGQEEAAPAEQVGGAAAEEEEAAEDERVARDRPADLRAAQLQVLGEARQGDVHGRDVEDHHQLGDEQHEQEQSVRAGSAHDRCVVTGSGSSCGGA